MFAIGFHALYCISNGTFTLTVTDSDTNLIHFNCQWKSVSVSTSTHIHVGIGVMSESVWMSLKSQGSIFLQPVVVWSGNMYCYIIKFSACLYLYGLVFHVTKCNVILISMLSDYGINMTASMTLRSYSIFVLERGSRCTCFYAYTCFCWCLRSGILIKLMRDLLKKINFCQISDTANNFCRDGKNGKTVTASLTDIR